MTYSYLIIGSGLTGSTIARQLLDRGKTCLVLEKRPHVGGNVYTRLVDGIHVHQYGAHIFHTNNEALWRYVGRFVHMNRYTNSPIANYQGRLYNLPFNMNTFYQLWGVRTGYLRKADQGIHGKAVGPPLPPASPGNHPPPAGAADLR